MGDPPSMKQVGDDSPDPNDIIKEINSNTNDLAMLRTQLSLLPKNPRILSDYIEKISEKQKIINSLYGQISKPINKQNYLDLLENTLNNITANLITTTGELLIPQEGLFVPDNLQLHRAEAKAGIGGGVKQSGGGEIPSADVLKLLCSSYIYDNFHDFGGSNGIFPGVIQDYIKGKNAMLPVNCEGENNIFFKEHIMGSENTYKPKILKYLSHLLLDRSLEYPYESILKTTRGGEGSNDISSEDPSETKRTIFDQGGYWSQFAKNEHRNNKNGFLTLAKLWDPSSASNNLSFFNGPFFDLTKKNSTETSERVDDYTLNIHNDQVFYSMFLYYVLLNNFGGLNIDGLKKLPFIQMTNDKTLIVYVYEKEYIFRLIKEFLTGIDNDFENMKNEEKMKTALNFILSEYMSPPSPEDIIETQGGVVSVNSVASVFGITIRSGVSKPENIDFTNSLIEKCLNVGSDDNSKKQFLLMCKNSGDVGQILMTYVLNLFKPHGKNPPINFYLYTEDQMAFYTSMILHLLLGKNVESTTIYSNNTLKPDINKTDNPDTPIDETPGVKTGLYNILTTPKGELTQKERCNNSLDNIKNNFNILLDTYKNSFNNIPIKLKNNVSTLFTTYISSLTKLLKTQNTDVMGIIFERETSELYVISGLPSVVKDTKQKIGIIIDRLKSSVTDDIDILHTDNKVIQSVINLINGVFNALNYTLSNVLQYTEFLKNFQQIRSNVFMNKEKVVTLKKSDDDTYIIDENKIKDIILTTNELNIIKKMLNYSVNMIKDTKTTNYMVNNVFLDELKRYGAEVEGLQYSIEYNNMGIINEIIKITDFFNDFIANEIGGLEVISEKRSTIKLAISASPISLITDGRIQVKYRSDTQSKAADEILQIYKNYLIEIEQLNEQRKAEEFTFQRVPKLPQGGPFRSGRTKRTKSQADAGDAGDAVVPDTGEMNTTPDVVVKYKSNKRKKETKTLPMEGTAAAMEGVKQGGKKQKRTRKVSKKKKHKRSTKNKKRKQNKKTNKRLSKKNKKQSRRKSKQSKKQKKSRKRN